MPSAFSHLILLDNLVKNYQISDESKKIISENSEYANWGAIGPDFLFFYPADWNPVIKEFLKLFYQINDQFDETIGLFESFKEMFIAPEEELQDMLTGGVYSDLSRITETSIATLLSKLELELLNSVDVFELVEPPIFKKYTSNEKKDWWWMDIAHHSNTLDFARNLWSASENNEKLRAYTYGYLTHIGGDVVGHGYVNSLVGGPYRNHWRRHTFVEKIIDTELWYNYFNKENLSSSKASNKIHFENDPFEFPKFPDELSDFISDAIKKTYANLNPSNGFPDSNDIKLMYTYFYKWMKASSCKTILNIPPPVEDFDWFSLPDDIRTKLESIAEPPTIYAPPGFNSSNPIEWKRFLISIFDFVKWASKALIIILTIPEYLIMRLATTPFRYILWLIQKLIYDVYESLKLALSTLGIIHPEKKFIDNHFSDIFKQGIQNLNYPYEKVFNNLQTYHLTHPKFQNGTIESPDNESQETIAFFERNIETDSPENWLLNKINSNNFDSFIDVKDKIQNHLIMNLKDNPISASDFNFRLFDFFEKHKGVGLPNWNLDVDRGLGWPEWIANNNKPWNNFNNFKF